MPNWVITAKAVERVFPDLILVPRSQVLLNLIVHTNVIYSVLADVRAVSELVRPSRRVLIPYEPSVDSLSSSFIWEIPFSLVSSFTMIETLVCSEGRGLCGS